MMRVRINKKLFLLLLALMALLQACVSDESLLTKDQERLAAAAKKRLAPIVRSETILVELSDFFTKSFPVEKKQKSLANYVDSIWVGDEVSPLSRGQTDLPRSLTRFHELVFATPAMRLEPMAARLSEIIAMPVQVLTSNVRGLDLIQQSQIRYRGPIRGLLDMMAASFEADWSYDRHKRRIVFTRVRTQQFNFSANADHAPLTKNEDFIVSQRNRFDPWAEIKESLARIVPKGSQASFSPMAGTITLTTTVSAMREAAQLIRRRDQNLQRQVYFGIRVLELGLRAQQGSINLEEELRTLSAGKLKINGASAPPKKDLPSQKEKGSAPLKGKRPQNGADLLIKALSALGDLSVLASSNGRISNGRILPVRSTTEHSYVARSKTSANLTDYTPATIKTGFYMDLRPRILSGRRVRVDLSVVLKSLDAFSDHGKEGNRLRLPHISTKSFTQEAIIPDNATLLLSGFEVKRTHSNTHRITLILITPHIL